MKKLEKVLLVFALLAMVIMPLSAAKTMKVSWQWLLNDPDVTAYRYQLNGEDESGWTVVDGNTDTYTVSGLDPYADYTLYLQCSYDGAAWSETATSTAYAMLTVEVPEPVVETVEEPVAAAPVEAAAPVTEPIAEAVVETPVEAPAEVAVEAPVATSYSFSLFGYEVAGEYTDGSFSSYVAQKGIVSSEDVQGFLSYEANKYGAILNGVYFTLETDGFSLSYPEGIDAALYLDTYKADLVEYINALFAAPVEPAVEEPVAAPLEEAPAATEYHFDIYGYGVSGSYAEGSFHSYTDNKNLVTQDEVAGFLSYEAQKYGTILNGVYFTLEADGFSLAYPEGIDAALYLDTYKADLVEYINTLFAAPVEPAAEVAVVPQEEPAVASVEEPVAAPAEETPEAEAVVPEPVENVRFKEVPAEEEAPAVEAIRYNQYKFVTGINGGIKANVVGTDIQDFSLRGNYLMEFRNVIKVGSRLGLGLRLDGNVNFKPISGWNAALASPSDMLHLGAWVYDAAADGKVMAYVNFKGATLYLGAGAGYSVAPFRSTDSIRAGQTFNALNHTFKTGTFVDASAGMSFDIAKHAAITLDLGYRYWLESKAQTASATVGLMLVF